MAFTMDVEMPVKEEIVEILQPAQEEKTALAVQADANVKELIAVDLNSMASRRGITDMIESFGQDSIERSKSKNKLLETRIGELSKAGSEGGLVVKSLTELNEEMRVLDPSVIDFTRTGILGKLFNPMREYFAKYEKADDIIQSIVERLEKGRKTLVNDNTTLECEQQSIRQITLTLNKQIEMGAAMDERLESYIEENRGVFGEEDKIKFLEEEILFPLRQRLEDLQQFQAVNQQGYLAMEVVRKNNKELIRGVDRALNVTTVALRTAVTVAMALAHQKVVLKCVNELNKTTNDLIASTSRMLKEQGAEIQKQAMETAVSPETLKQAFADTFEALDALSAYKHEALPKMKQAIAEFKEMADEGEKRIQFIEGGNAVR